jgi:hypothetical protein
MEEPFSSKTVGTSSSGGRRGFGGGGGGRIGGGASASEANPTGSDLVDCHMFRMRDGKVDLIMSIVGPSAASMGWPLEPIESHGNSGADSFFEGSAFGRRLGCM